MMIDYAAKLNQQALLHILAGAARLTGLHYTVFSWGGSCFLVSCQDQVTSYLRSIVNGDAKLMMVEFGSTSPQWMERANETIAPLLKPLINALTPSDTLPSRTAPAIPLIDLDTLDTLLMPTLNGLLLGYPVVYYVTTAEESQKAAMALSSESLTLFRVLSGETILSSFSVPSHLIPGGGDHPLWASIANWADKMMSAQEDARFEHKEVGLVFVSL